MRDIRPIEPIAERQRRSLQADGYAAALGGAATSRGAAGAAEREIELRRVLLGVLVAGLLVTLAELTMPLAPGDEPWPVVALVFVGVGLVASVIALVRASAFTVRLLRVSMIPIVVIGLAGLWLVHQSSVLLLLDLYTPLVGLRPLFGSVAASIPAFAPAVAILLGLLGLACTYRHPLLG